MTSYEGSIKKFNPAFQTINNQNALIQQTTNKVLNSVYQELNQINLTQSVNAFSAIQKVITQKGKLTAQSAKAAISAMNKSISSFTPEFYHNLNASLECMKSAVIPTSEALIALNNSTTQIQSICSKAAATVLHFENEVSLNKGVPENTASFIDPALPDGEEQSGILSKIKGKISISDLLSLISLILTILFFAYGQIASDKSQDESRQQNDIIIQELQNDKNYQSKLLNTIQQLTNTVNDLWGKYELSSNSKKDFKDKQDNQKIYYPNINSEPEN